MNVLGIGEFAVSADPGHTLCTRLLGSRLAVLCHCPGSGAVGLLHLAFPRSASDPVQAAVLPGIYADTGVDSLIRQLRPLCRGDIRNLSVVLVGGDESECGQHGFLAKENVKAATQALAVFGLVCGTEVLGGGHCRTVNLEAGSGRVRITTANAFRSPSPSPSLSGNGSQR
jgi:chemotaxis protein CheD